MSDGGKTREAQPNAEGRDWGLALGLSFTFCAVIFSGWSIPVRQTTWAFWCLIGFAYLFLAMGFLGVFVEVNRLLTDSSIRFRRVVNLLVALVVVAVSASSYSFLGSYAAARWAFGALLAFETLGILILVGGIGQTLATRARNYVFAFIPGIVAGFFFLGWLVFAGRAVRISLGVFCALSLIVAAAYLAMGFQLTIERSSVTRRGGLTRSDSLRAGTRAAELGRKLQKVAALIAFLLGVAAAVATIYAAFAQNKP